MTERFVHLYFNMFNRFMTLTNQIVYIVGDNTRA